MKNIKTLKENGVESIVQKLLMIKIGLVRFWSGATGFYDYIFIDLCRLPD